MEKLYGKLIRCIIVYFMVISERQTVYSPINDRQRGREQSDNTQGA